MVFLRYVTYHAMQMPAYTCAVLREMTCPIDRFWPCALWRWWYRSFHFGWKSSGLPLWKRASQNVTKEFNYVLQNMNLMMSVRSVAVLTVCGLSLVVLKCALTWWIRQGVHCTTLGLVINTICKKEMQKWVTLLEGCICELWMYVIRCEYFLISRSWFSTNSWSDFSVF